MLFIGGEVLSTPSYESAGLGSNAGPGSRYTAHPADHPPFQADQQIVVYLRKVTVVF